MENIRILIVDDSAVIIDGIQSILGGQPDMMVVGEASSGKAAEALCDEVKPDVALVDAQMPFMSGVETTRSIKRSHPNTKVLFMAMHVSCIDDAVRAGADSVIMKDSGRQELVSEIRRLAALDSRHDTAQQ